MDIPRKIQVTGTNTYILSLPHSWIEKNNITKGTPIYLKENQDGSLQLTTSSSNSVGEKRHTISISSGTFENDIRNIVSAYVSGAETILLKGEETYTVAEEARRVLSGVEITDETENLIVMKIRTDFTDLRYDSILRRIYNITRSMFSLMLRSFENGEKHLEELRRKEGEVDRLYLLALRQVSSSSNRPAQDEAVFKSIAAKAIEKVSDHLETMYATGTGFMPNKKIAKLLTKASEVYSAAYGFFADGPAGIDTFEAEKATFLKLYDSFEAIIRKEKDAKRMLDLKSVAENCLKIVRYSSDIVESGNDLLFAKLGERTQGK